MLSRCGVGIFVGCIEQTERDETCDCVTCDGEMHVQTGLWVDPHISAASTAVTAWMSDATEMEPREGGITGGKSTKRGGRGLSKERAQVTESPTTAHHSIITVLRHARIWKRAREAKENCTIGRWRNGAPECGDWERAQTQTSEPTKHEWKKKRCCVPSRKPIPERKQATAVKNSY